MKTESKFKTRRHTIGQLAARPVKAGQVVVSIEGKGKHVKIRIEHPDDMPIAQEPPKTLDQEKTSGL